MRCRFVPDCRFGWRLYIGFDGLNAMGWFEDNSVRQAQAVCG